MKYLSLLLLLTTSLTANAEKKIPIKVVVVSMFESGEVTGDRPGEFQFWVERLPLDQKHDFPAGGTHPIYTNKDGVLGVCTDGGVTNATATIMALGMDERFDLSEAYWVIAGIAGGDPADVSLGSGVWARYVIDGDLAYEIDAREMPEGWSYGMIPLGAYKPAMPGDDVSQGWTVDTVNFTLNEGLANWAYETSKDVKLKEFPATRAFGEMFKGYPNAVKPPFVTLGETLSSSTYWHGHHLNKWANDWVQVYSNDKMNFMTSNMEDSGTLTAMERLDRIGKMDIDRVMVLRTVSNFTVPPPGKTTAWSTTADYPDDGIPAKETAFIVGNEVVQAILSNWTTYRTNIPSVPTKN